MHKILKKRLPWQIKAFTLLESLVTLFVLSFLTLLLSGAVEKTFDSVKETLFWLQFEQIYRDTQKLSATRQSQMTLDVTSTVTNGYTSLALPETVTALEPKHIVFDSAGGNSSLAKIQFQTADKLVTYQLYLGSGNFKKSETSRLHSP